MTVEEAGASGGYGAAVESVGFSLRERGRLRVTGRAPVQMLGGVVTSSIPAGPERVAPDVLKGRSSYSAVLTPKGRLVSDLRILRLDEGRPAVTGGATTGPVQLPTGESDETLELDVPASGVDPIRAHLSKYVPPRFAKVEDISLHSGFLTVMGPDAAGVVSREALGLRVEESDLRELEEGEYLLVELGGEERVTAMRSREVATFALDLLGHRDTVEALARRLPKAGAIEVDQASLRVLRVEAGRPAFGLDMDEEVLPVEAGIHERAIDYEKGCYTGQEVIVRIRDRGHVNRHLRGFRLGGEPPPLPGTELFAPDVRQDRHVGWITSAVVSPRAGETLALGYARREVEPGVVKVRIGHPDGPEAQVVDLSGGDWGV